MIPKAISPVRQSFSRIKIPRLIGIDSTSAVKADKSRGERFFLAKENEEK